LPCSEAATTAGSESTHRLKKKNNKKSETDALRSVRAEEAATLETRWIRMVVWAVQPEAKRTKKGLVPNEATKKRALKGGRLVG